MKDHQLKALKAHLHARADGMNKRMHAEIDALTAEDFAPGRGLELSQSLEVKPDEAMLALIGAAYEEGLKDGAPPPGAIFPYDRPSWARMVWPKATF